MRDFFYEPAKGIRTSPQQFGEGLIKGTSSLFVNSLSGVFNTTSKITGSVGNVAALLSMDQEYIDQRKKDRHLEARHVTHGIIMGAKDFGNGLLQGVSGMFTNPIKGGQEEGAIGVLKGLGKGLTGMVVKPVAGTLDMTTRLQQGIKNTFTFTARKRVRPPRVMPRNKVLAPYCRHSAEGQMLLFTVEEGIHFQEEHFYDFHYVGSRCTLIVSNTSFFLVTYKEEKYTMRWTLPIGEISAIKVRDKGLFVNSGNKSYLIPSFSEEEKLFIYFQLKELYEREVTNNSLTSRISSDIDLGNLLQWITSN